MYHAFLHGRDAMVLAVLGDNPDQNLEIFFTPILFYSLVLNHPENKSKWYFSTRFLTNFITVSRLRVLGIFMQTF